MVPPGQHARTFVADELFQFGIEKNIFYPTHEPCRHESPPPYRGRCVAVILMLVSEFHRDSFDLVPRPPRLRARVSLRLAEYKSAKSFGAGNLVQ